MPVAIDDIPVKTREAIAEDLYHYWSHRFYAQFLKFGMYPPIPWEGLPEPYKKLWLELGEHVCVMIQEAVGQTVRLERKRGH